MKRNKNRPPITLLPMALWTTVFVAVPLVYVLGLSFMKKAATWGVVAEFSLDSYKNLLNPVYLKVFAQSFWVAILTTVFALLIGYPFAYFTAKLPKKHRSLVLMLMLVPFWTNSLVRIYGWMILLRSQGVINGLLMQFGVIDKPLKLLYTFGAVLVGMVYALLPFMVLAIYNSVCKVDWSLVEASRDLGAGRAKAFFTVTLPLTMPGVMAGCVLVFIPSVGLFFISDLLGGAKTMLLGNLIKNELLSAKNWPMGAALSIAMMAVTLLVIRLYQHFSRDQNLEGLL
ncbi:ABC transporter permease [Merdimmobilis hominis]|jgi:spermidine/putrescine transport system permease protein|uniref:Spermidine/putrescine transport system permease protein PotB n=1 Tax=uncultured Anaerotruncus sp. TaxID=905011 RepID=A0A6N2TTS9_9FIRM|nr:ABC transporter permease [Merdimmobilis hominis]MCD4835608.1 ABC transporter permease [Merdimmobilis hominis]PWL63711.1 MAG: ABC transporter permease [Oscillospiraceae bacterium]